MAFYIPQLQVYAQPNYDYESGSTSYDIYADGGLTNYYGTISSYDGDFESDIEDMCENEIVEIFIDNNCYW